MNNRFDKLSDELKNLTDDEASLLIERLVKLHGGEILDRARDRMIDQDERGEWPEPIS